MGRPPSLLSSTLVLNSHPAADQCCNQTTSQRPVFGEPFKFGKDLVFNRSYDQISGDGLYPGHGSTAALATVLCHTAKSSRPGSNSAVVPHASPAHARLKTKLQHHKHGSSSKQLPPARRSTDQQGSPAILHQLISHSTLAKDASGHMCPPATAITTRHVPQHVQPEHEPAEVQPVSTTAFQQTANPVAEASRYYLSALGAALANGCATPAAAAAAVAAMASTAAQLAGFVAGRDMVNPSHGQSHTGCISITAAGASAAAVAAACSSCQGCRRTLERLQHCSTCGKRRPDTSGLPDSSCSRVDAVGGTGNGSTRGKRKLTCCHVKATDVTPGPGEYNVGSTFGQGVAFSIGAKPTGSVSRAEQSDIPGPGSYYNVSNSRSTGGPAFSIAGRWKEPRQDSAAPGPGEHQQLMFIAGGPAFTISGKWVAASRSSREGSSSPGPGAYAADWDRSPSPSGPAYSLGGRTFTPGVSKDAFKLPGPADYQHVDFQPEGPAYTFQPRSCRRNSNVTDGSTTPAPTDYDTSSINAFGSAGPAYTIAMRPPANSGKPFKEPSPGPGSYYGGDSGPAGPAFSMGVRPEGQKDEHRKKRVPEPGPGEYHRELGSSAPAFTIGNKPSAAGPDDGSADNLRGPGMYYNPEAEAAMSGKTGFTIGSRFASTEGRAGAGSPGPASYATPADKKGPSYTIGARPQVAADHGSDSPGPAAYSHKPSVPQGPRFTMGTKPKEKDTADKDAGPAVGEYDVLGKTVKGPSWTMGTKTDEGTDKGAADTPGPGYYACSLVEAPSGPAWTMGTRPQVTNTDYVSASPGPGDYYDSSNRVAGAVAGHAFTVGTRLLAQQEADEETPGPGAYLSADYRDAAAADAPAYTLGTRPAAKHPATTLGPGAYDTAELAKGPAYTIGTRVKGDREGKLAADSPGPAAYDADGAAAALEAAAPAWTMGQRQRELGTASGTHSPAPGDYTPAGQGPGGPAWTMSVKLTAAVAGEEQPGPGSYALTDTLPGAQGPAWSMGQRWTDDSAHGGESPAPGMYDVPAGSAGAAFTMGARPNPPAAAAATPAPGQYCRLTKPGVEAPAFTMAGRADGAAAFSSDTGPGPGSYEQKLAADAPAAPAYTMGVKLANIGTGAAGHDAPGAGQYDVAAVGPAGPAFTMGGRLATDGKIPEGPGPDYSVEGAIASTMAASPAFTMGARASQIQNYDSDLPAPGQYHSVATAGAAPSVPSAPAYTIQGKQKKGKSRLKKMLGRLAYLDEATPGPGEHQSSSSVNTLMGPAYSFKHGVDADKTFSTTGHDTGSSRPSGQTLAQLQVQLARLILKETQQATRQASKATTTPKAGSSSTAEQGGASSGKRYRLPSAATGAVLAQMSQAVDDALQAGSNRRRKQSSSSSSKDAPKDFASPAPGDHYTASPAGSIGISGPAFTMAGKAQTGPSRGSFSSFANAVADANGYVNVFAAAAAADRAAGVPGPGTYNTNKPFPRPDGAVVYKPILKKRSDAQSSSVRRVSWADAA